MDDMVIMNSKLIQSFSRRECVLQASANEPPLTAMPQASANEPPLATLPPQNFPIQSQSLQAGTTWVSTISAAYTFLDAGAG